MAGKFEEKKISIKSYSVPSDDGQKDITADLELINKHTKVELTADDVFLFDVILCDNDIDRVYDKMSDTFLEKFAEISKGLTGLKDHDWGSDNQMSRLYDTEVVTDDTVKTKLGESRKYVLGKAYTLIKFIEYVDKIKAGLIKEVSVSFESKNDTCSICGKVTKKGNNDVAICPDGHIMGNEYDGKLCYNNLNELTDAYEWSLVAVPCQKNSGIKHKNIINGGKRAMKFKWLKFMHSKEFKNLSEECQKNLEELAESAPEAELTEDEIKGLIEENEELKSQLCEIKAKLEDAENGRINDKIDTEVEKAVDELEPLTETVKENIIRDIDKKSLKVESDKVVGLDVAIEGIKAKYKGLFRTHEVVENKPVEKSVTGNVGITFSAGSFNSSNTVAKSVKPGITIE